MYTKHRIQNSKWRRYGRLLAGTGGALPAWYQYIVVFLLDPGYIRIYVCCLFGSLDFTLEKYPYRALFVATPLFFPRLGCMLTKKSAAT